MENGNCRGERERERERGREREREREGERGREREKPTFFLRRLRGPSSSGGCEERESRGERKRKRGGERKEERKVWVYTNVTIIEIWYNNVYIRYL